MKILLFLISSAAFGQYIGTAPLPQKFLGTTTPGSVSGNLPGDLYLRTSTGDLYVCSAASGTAAPACTSVAGGAWTLVNVSGGATAFSALTSATNTTAAMVVGSGGSVTVSGSGTNNATSVDGLGETSAATASKLAARDANANLIANSFLRLYATVTTAAGTTTLTAASNQVQRFIGSTTQICALPAVSSDPLNFNLINLSSGDITVNSSGGNLVATLHANTSASVKSNATSGTGASVWDVSFNGFVSPSFATLTLGTSNVNLATATTGAVKVTTTTGAISQAACADLSNAAASCSTDTTSATNISAGTLAAARGGTGVSNTATLTLGSSNVNLASATTGAIKVTTTTGAITQAACADLSNGTALCSTSPGSGVATFLATPSGANFNSMIASGGIPVNCSGTCSKSANYTTVLGDGGGVIEHAVADNNARTFTIDSNANVAYPLRTIITIVNNINTVTISITSDTMTLAGTSSTGSRTLAVNGIATLYKTGATTWLISGPGVT